MKQRFSALDVCASVADIRQKVVDHRLQNIYDVNSKTYLLKFAKPDSKDFLLIESGIRLHTTDFSRDKATIPSNFCMKLRKHLRTRRLTAVTQLGLDRIVDFEFAGNEHIPTYHLITEFYASGNIILTDGNYRIMTLLRVVQPNETTRIAVDTIYDIQQFGRPFTPMTQATWEELVAQAKSGEMVKKFLNQRTVYGPQLSEHIIRTAGLEPNIKFGTGLPLTADSPESQRLLNQFAEADVWITHCMAHPQPGYIVLAPPAPTEIATPTDVFLDFQPFLFAQLQDKPIRKFDHFDKAVDHYFSLLESQKLEMQTRGQEEAALRKLDYIRQEHLGRIQGLEQAQVRNVAKANALDARRDQVEQTIAVIRNAVASGLSWSDIDELIRDQKAQGNPLALTIHALKLESNRITLALPSVDSNDEEESESSESNDDLFATDDEDEDDADEKAAPSTLLIDVDIYQTVFANVRSYFDVKKKSAFKHSKTVAVSQKALKSAQRTIEHSLKETRITATINKMRKPLWFERFLWFISSEGYLVLAGRDMQQNELLVQKHLQKGDIYVHADLHGAASVIVKNHGPGEVPPSTLLQAGIMSVCQSKAWEAKIVTSAWCVQAHQVSKSAPTGEYLTTGSFMIRGKKTFLPPAQLVYGFGILFRLEESCIGKHLAEHRRDQSEAQELSGDLDNSQPAEVNVAEAVATADEPTTVVTAEDFAKARARYNLDDLNQPEANDEGNAAAPSNPKNGHPDVGPPAPNQRRPLTAKERRLQRQNHSKGPEPAPKPKAAPRSRRGKTKKKSAQQEDEEWERKLQQHQAPSDLSEFAPLANSEPEAGAEAEATDSAGPSLSTNSPEVSTTNPQPEESAPVAQDQISVSESDPRQNANEAAEIRQLLLEENIVPIEPEDNVSLLDSLTATPFADDILLSAVPVCAPYTALQNYKYKVKLTPGTLKKGKACKSALAVFLTNPESTAQEKALMKSVPDTDLISQMLAKVKVSAPNLELARKSLKKKR
ncbi:fibronectin-binding protein A N-terminus-domain-containing protein [Dimargaris cristalligena]|uniref:Fibronectin-binding protein A N-terminus-domain-containing protein n=1 Tax=Dimargaris cristalligena TaxID=215637 RepID=A0A4P9ZP07_9FUNG|nr:fibronectin-binding protein A N-terminus-domain-containing protein [Dimargaris cristalligena]|eukprot:RKP34361.1 fibronectin-binding protein A N-terminus-domain-containing protein [Dimargaris cristalligena]